MRGARFKLMAIGGVDGHETLTEFPLPLIAGGGTQSPTDAEAAIYLVFRRCVSGLARRRVLTLWTVCGAHA